MTPAVLFLIFNRPDTTALVFARIREARPTRLYLAADGPRANRLSDTERCIEVRRIASSVDWPCQVFTLFRNENLGCRRAVSGAITWFFDHEEEGIILEDDTLPDLTFFRYCADLLERYRSETRVMAIVGGSYFPSSTAPRESYCFSRVFDPWGWASWRRAWAYYDDQFTDYGRFCSEVLPQIGPISVEWMGHWLWQFGNTRAGEVDTWDYQWIYSIMRKNAVVAAPRVNLVSNLGFGPEATHTVVADDINEPAIAALPTEPMSFPLIHPRSFRVDMLREAEFLKARHGVRAATRGQRLAAAFRRHVTSRVPASLKRRLQGLNRFYL